ncbi:SubName: Full=Uncharacterized protein {ECO:0000313/EMBL:CCA67338.1} [Serendipita indica DSM 11827]|nr:SubName: Full=Uncharacterized protein {ECO:0000313/EMBL:CCA67338.1} [Serendipita indica DSM 11827]
MDASMLIGWSQDNSDDASNDADGVEVKSMGAELHDLERREIMDRSILTTASLPHMTFSKPKLGAKKAVKPSSTLGSTSMSLSLSNASNFNSSTIAGSSTSTATMPARPPPRQIADIGNLSQKIKQVSAKKEQARRSSFAKRGKRVSGSFETGEAVMPHESVPSAKLYRHIDEDLPEAHRVRHLLVWCARRAAAGESPTKSKSKLGQQDSALLASIQDKVVRQLMDLTIDIPLYDVENRGKRKPDEPLMDDPINVRNRELKERLTIMEEKARDEDRMWAKVISDYNALQASVLSTLPQTSASTPGKHIKRPTFDVRLSELDEKWQEVDKEIESYRMELESGKIRELDTQLAKRCRKLPFELDSLRQSLARSNAFTEQAKEFIDDLFASINATSSGPSSLKIAGATQPASNSVDLFRALTKTTSSDTPSQPPGATGLNGHVINNRRLTAVVQPSTPRRMPGTPRRGNA